VGLGERNKTSNNSLHPTTGPVTTRAYARPAPDPVAGEPNVRRTKNLKVACSGLLGDIMNQRLVLLAAVLALIFVAACSDNGTTPGDQEDVERLVGVWHVISVTSGETTTQLPEGNIYWHFKTGGEFCDENRNAYGEYMVLVCGEVGCDLVLSEEWQGEIIRKSQLVLSAGGDSLSTRIIEASVIAADRIDLVRADERDPVECECE